MAQCLALTAAQREQYVDAAQDFGVPLNHWAVFDKNVFVTAAETQLEAFEASLEYCLTQFVVETSQVHLIQVQYEVAEWN